MNQKIFIHVDMNAFFASIEQRDFPELYGMPVAVTNGKYGSCIITCSYEARAFGIKTGMKIYEGKKICPYLIQRPSRPNVYAATSTLIKSKLPCLIFWGSIPCDISLIFISGSILLMTPFTIPTEPSSSPKSDAKEIILLIMVIIR